MCLTGSGTNRSVAYTVVPVSARGHDFVLISSPSCEYCSESPIPDLFVHVSIRSDVVSAQSDANASPILLLSVMWPTRSESMSSRTPKPHRSRVFQILECTNLGCPMFSTQHTMLFLWYPRSIIFHAQQTWRHGDLYGVCVCVDRVFEKFFDC